MSIYGDDYGIEVPPTYNTGDESVFDPTYGGTLPPASGDGESVFDPTYGGTLPATGGVDTSGISGIIKKLFSDGKGGVDLLKLGALGGGLAGLLGSNKSSSAPTGYQGSIPKYTATRNMVTAPTAGRRPGAGGTRYGGDVTFTPRGSSYNGNGIASGIAAGIVDQNKYDKPAYDGSNMEPRITQPVGPSNGQIDMSRIESMMNQQKAKYAGADPSMLRHIDPNSAAHNMAHGGIAMLAKGGEPRYLQGQTDGMADKIPAQIGRDQPAALSHGEFVIPADVVSHLGNGNSDAGAKKLYSMMDKIREARTGTKEQGKEINPDKFMPGGLAQAYAAGGEVQRFQTGGISGVGTAANAGVTGTESNLSNWVGPYVTDMLGKGQALSEMPYQEYGGPLTAGESSLQSKVFGGLQNVNFPGQLGQSFSSAGAPTIGANGQPVGGGTSPAAQYMNPYLQSVLDPQLAELRRQNQITNMGANAKLTSAGAFGGGRQAIMNAENDRNMMQEMNKTVGQGYSNAYDKAMQQFNTEQGQGMGLANLMAQQGSQQRGIESEGIAADKAAFEEARANPYKMVQFQQSLLSGLPLAAQQINSAQPSTFANVLTGAGSVASLLNSLGLGVTPATPPAK